MIIDDESKTEQLIVGDEYWHFEKGARYRVTGVAINEFNGQQMVLYKCTKNAVLWCCTRHEFFELVDYMGGKAPRFSMLLSTKNVDNSVDDAEH